MERLENKGHAHLLVKKDVLWLQVPVEGAQESLALINSQGVTHTGVSVRTPVNYVERVQMSQRAGHLSDVEFCPRLRKGPLFLEVEEELKRV